MFKLRLFIVQLHSVMNVLLRETLLLLSSFGCNERHFLIKKDDFFFCWIFTIAGLVVDFPFIASVILSFLLPLTKACLLKDWLTCHFDCITTLLFLPFVVLFDLTSSFSSTLSSNNIKVFCTPFFAFSPAVTRAVIM